MKSYEGMTTEERRRAYVALERYYEWSASLARRFDERLLKLGDEGSYESRSDQEVLSDAAITGYWFASLMPLIEGYEQLQLRDDRIDSLLYLEPVRPPQQPSKPSHFDKLRRFRNGMFHYQSAWDDPRFMDFMNDDQARIWAIRMSTEFRDFFQHRKRHSDLIKWLTGPEPV